MKILLVEPPACSPLEKAVMGVALTEPLALEMAAGGVEARHDVRLLDMRIEPGALEETCLDFQPDLVAVTAYTAGRDIALEVLSRARVPLPACRTVAGGHHATLVPQDFARPQVDFVVLGEGERSFEALVESLDRGEGGAGVPGTGRREGERMVLAPARDPAPMDALPEARRDLTARYRREKRYFRGHWRPVASAVTSRGCPFRCSFCAMWKIHGGRYRKRSPERIASEVAALAEPYVDFADDNTLHDPRQSEALARALGAIRPRKTYKIYARTDAIVRRPDLVERWAEAGLGLALVGFEAFREEDLGKVRKGTTLAVNEEAMEILRRNGVEIASYFLVRPEFTERDFRELSAYVERKGLTQPYFSVLTPFPGTDFYEEVRDRLVTDDVKQFDLFHSVLPTALSPIKFHRQVAGLWERAYGPGGIAEGRLPKEAMEVLVREEAIASLVSQKTGST